MVFSFLSNFTPFILFSFVQNVLMWSKEYDTELCIRFVVWFVFFFIFVRIHSLDAVFALWFVIQNQLNAYVIWWQIGTNRENRMLLWKRKKKSTKQLQLKLLKLLLLLHKIAIGYCPFVVFFFVHISVICIAMHTVTAVVFHFLNSCLFLF